MSKIKDQFLITYFEHGIDLINRRIFLLDDIDNLSMGNIIKAVYLMAAEDDKKPIELFISSFGGTVYEALSLYDVFNSIECPIITISFGKVMSAALLLAAVGTSGERYATPYTAFMVHDLSDEISGKLSAIKADVKHLEKLGNIYLELLTKHSKMDKRFWRKFSNKSGDYYFDAYQAQEYGIIDNIWCQKEGD